MNRNGPASRGGAKIVTFPAAASEQEAAAISAALEAFIADTAAPAAPISVSRWQRAALLEGVERAPRADVWGGQPRR